MKINSNKNLELNQKKKHNLEKIQEYNNTLLFIKTRKQIPILQINQLPPFPQINPPPPDNTTILDNIELLKADIANLNKKSKTSKTRKLQL